MIRLYLKEGVDYQKLREDYFKRVLKYIAIDQRDVFPESTDTGKKKHTGSISETKRTARTLKEYYPSLFCFLFDDLETVNVEHLKLLLTGPDTKPESFGGNGPAALKDTFEYILEQCPLPADQETARLKCKKIFSYKRFSDQQQDVHWLLRELGVRVCPYCNRIYITTNPPGNELGKGEEFLSTRAEIDHFYPQGKYPFFALSLFNFIPSCHVCNLNKKEQEHLVYPYDEGFEKKAVFRLVPDLSKADADHNIFGYLKGEHDRFHVRIMGIEGLSLQDDISLERRLADIEDEAYRKRIQNSIQALRLERIYGEHKSEILDLLKQCYYLNPEYLRAAVFLMYEETGMAEGMGLEEFQDKMMDTYFGYLQQKKWGEMPLSKLKADIIEQVYMSLYRGDLR